MGRKIMIAVFSFSLGFILASSFFAPKLMAQYGAWSGGGFTEKVAKPELPSRYGRLVAVSGLKMYFQGEGGSVYIVTPKTSTQLGSEVVVLKRKAKAPQE